MAEQEINLDSELLEVLEKHTETESPNVENYNFKPPFESGGGGEGPDSEQSSENGSEKIEEQMNLLINGESAAVITDIVCSRLIKMGAKLGFKTDLPLSGLELTNKERQQLSTTWDAYLKTVKIDFSPSTTLIVSIIAIYFSKIIVMDLQKSEEGRGYDVTGAAERKNPNNTGLKYKCSNCGKTGHTKRNCPEGKK